MPTPDQLVTGWLYTVNGDPNELVYAMDLSKWFLVGEERTFAVEPDGTVIDLTPESTEVMTLDAFDLADGYMPRCRDCKQFNDWDHEEICPGAID